MCVCVSHCVVRRARETRSLVVVHLAAVVNTVCTEEFVCMSECLLFMCVCVCVGGSCVCVCVYVCVCV